MIGSPVQNLAWVFCISLTLMMLAAVLEYRTIALVFLAITTIAMLLIITYIAWIVGKTRRKAANPSPHQSHLKQKEK